MCCCRCDEQGEVGDNFYVVYQGECDVCVRDEDGVERCVLTCGRCGSFGELALMCAMHA